MEAELTTRIAQIRESILDIEYALKHGEYGAIQTQVHWIIGAANQIGWILALHERQLALQSKQREATQCP